MCSIQNRSSLAWSKTQTRSGPLPVVRRRDPLPACPSTCVLTLPSALLEHHQTTSHLSVSDSPLSLRDLLLCSAPPAPAESFSSWSMRIPHHISRTLAQCLSLVTQARPSCTSGCQALRECALRRARACPRLPAPIGPRPRTPFASSTPSTGALWQFTRLDGHAREESGRMKDGDGTASPRLWAGSARARSYAVRTAVLSSCSIRSHDAPGAHCLLALSPPERVRGGHARRGRRVHFRAPRLRSRSLCHKAWSWKAIHLVVAANSRAMAEAEAATQEGSVHPTRLCQRTNEQTNRAKAGQRYGRAT